jgi:hypothetical protein
MSDKINDANPTIVVIIAKNEGLNLDNIVFKTSLCWDELEYFIDNSLYLTIKCNTIEIVIISCSEIKFDDMTVTSQPKNPKIPVVDTTESKQINRGRITHLI